jgi:hypothetical protein
MQRRIVVNLPVANLAAAMEFFRRLGFGFDAQFTNASAGCMVVSDTIYVMLLDEPTFTGFSPKPIADAKLTAEVLVCLTCASRAGVDALVKKAVAAGGRTYNDPQEHGETMYSHGFQDLDGHVWELMHIASV